MGIRILVVEDEAEIADFLVRGLREEGFTVEHAGDVESARHLLKVAEWDIVLLDRSLPDGDGLSILKPHRDAGGDVPVLVLTARDSVGDRVRGLDSGADDYLCKPFAFEELLARVRALVRRPRGGGPLELTVADVKVDLATHRTERAGKSLSLTAKEQALLTFFLRHPGEVLTRTRIYEHVWDERYDGSSNTLEVHIKELRRKLEARGPRLIHTLRGRGYLFGDPPESDEDGLAWTLTNRLSSAFLGAIALILIGFSTALYVLASSSLNRSIDDRLDGALETLGGLVEDEPDGLDWERDGRQLALGLEPGHDEVRWLILDGRGVEVDRSRNLGDPAVLLRPASRQADAKRQPWRIVHRRFDSSRVATARRGRSLTMVLAVGLPLEPMDRPLQRLGLALVVLSVVIWGLTALIGRRLCRTALGPLSSMAAEAKGLGAAEPGRRLAVAETGDELHELAVSFNALLDRWQEALERQSRFAGDASHQLRTPLTALIGQVDVALRRDRPAEDYRDVLARVRDQADRLRRIIEALLFLARSDPDAGPPRLEVFDLATWTDDQLRRRSAEGREGPDRLADPPGRPIPVQSHPELLAEVLDNLVDNAVHHGRGPIVPTVRVSTQDGRAVMVVEDHGPGIAAGELGRIFEPFYRSVAARKNAPRGVGLGLAVAKRIVRSVGGRLEVASEIGQGTRFSLSLPIAGLADDPILKVEATA